VRLDRMYHAGEPVWMAADAMIKFAQGKHLADRADRDSPARLRRLMRKTEHNSPFGWGHE
jgi:hypothetical protein